MNAQSSKNTKDKSNNNTSSKSSSISGANVYIERYNSRHAKLNDKQCEAVETIDGPLLVVAGPGSGKTELLSLRTANILLNTQVSPHNILLLTFTDSGAQNMRERLVQIIGETAYRVAIYTFHSFASDIMGRYAEYFFDGANYKPVGEVEKLSIIEDTLARLDRSNPLSSKHFEKGYTYTKDVISLIAALKKGNLSPEEWRKSINESEIVYEKINSVCGELLAEISGKRKFDIVRDGYLKIYAELENINNTDQNSITKYLLATLGLELKLSIDTGEYKNLNDWRDSHFTKNTNKNTDRNADFKILKDSREEKISKWKALADVYESYNNEMHKRGLYDFEDMIFMVARELKSNSILRNELEEKYQYIMVDEFQDTNESQFSLIESLTMSPINEGSPNVMAVGDDDQAIYKFQGAELDNIFKFRTTYPTTKFIVLDKNYRSTQEILDKARSVITVIEDRLETRYPGEINKRITASNAELIENRKANGNAIIEKSFDNQYSELDYIASECKRLLGQGCDPKEITVISKSHANLRSLSKVMGEYNVPYSYEKREHVLDKKPIHELITIVEFVTSGMTNIKEELLPEILSYKFWGIERIDIWRLAEAVKKGSTATGELGEKIYTRGSWIGTMLASDNSKISDIANFLIKLITDAQSVPLEHLLDEIIGTKEWEIVSEHDDVEGDIEVPSKGNFGPSGGTNLEYISPFKQYYFGKDNFDHNKPEYLEFLFALRTFIGALREYNQGEVLHAKDLSSFVEVYTNNDNLSLNLVSPFATSDTAITLQTAHKSKGLEYEYVFIINSDEDEWSSRGMTNKIGTPAHLQLLPNSDSLDDRIRLYYVAMTRSKHTLYITNNKNKFGALMTNNSNLEAGNSAGKNANTSELSSPSVISKELINNLYFMDRKEIVNDEKVLLKRLLENYKMPVTHMINYLNISKVGPDKFIEQNLLKFPQAMSASSIYGSAMHEAMQNFYLYYKKNGNLATLEALQTYFKNAMNLNAMSKIEADKYLKSGAEALDIYYHDLIKRGVNPTDMVEVDFAREGVVIRDVQATGKIDKMEFRGGTIVVTDLKTGKSFDGWDSKTNTNDLSEYDKIKLHFFKYQLAYYALLIRNSRSYHQYSVEKGYIEFLEPDKSGAINILELDITTELIDRVEKLSNLVYNKIINLDFPNTDNYKIDDRGEEKEIKLKDIEDFEERLLSLDL